MKHYGRSGKWNCTVCGSANLDEFTENIWCEDCGTLFVGESEAELRAWQPEKSMLHQQVMAFHKRFGQSIGEKPHVPDDKTVRFRLSLIAEEFFELLAAAGLGSKWDVVLDAQDSIKDAIKEFPIIKVDLPEFVDALADLMYVIEGAAITMGMNMTPITAEVHRANMAKMPSYVAEKDALHHGATVEEFARRQVGPTTVIGFDVEHAAPVKRADGKIGKPPGWTPPDVLGELVEQGYKP